MTHSVRTRTRHVALCLVAAAAGASAQGAGISLPTTIADSSHSLSVQPSLAGFTIGEPAAAAIKRLGTPLQVDTLGGGENVQVSYANASTGITIICVGAQGVGIILVTSRAAGALDGVHVGDTRASVVARWGPPAAGGEDSGVWLAGANVIAVSFDESGKVERLGIGAAR